jgi:type II secretory ATPase GspE/PulE/Tfp pilus assembly ATPase PilB-like protein
VRLDELGMGTRERELLEAATKRPHGMLIVTGPTGSGKTTTLYAALLQRSAAEEKIVTVEEPIEYQLAGVTQVPVHRQTGVTFATALRAILRQDPDVVMVGEMRDAETAETAVQAAMTGHLVLSTLHTNDALSAVARLIDLGVPEYLCGATLDLVVAQRLVRRLCTRCAVSHQPLPSQLATLGRRPVRSVETLRAVGCEHCRGTGYRGRTGVFEAVQVTESLRTLISRRATTAQLRDAAEAEGFVPLGQNAAELVMSGVTSIEEALRVVQS